MAEWQEYEAVATEPDSVQWNDFEPAAPLIKPSPYEAADIASMTAGQGKARTGMEAGAEFTEATGGAPYMAIPNAIANAGINKALLGAVNIPYAISRITSPLTGVEPLEPVTELPEIKLPRASGEGFMSGAANVALGGVESLLQPSNLAMLPLMGGGGPIGKAIMTAFGAQQVAAIPKQVQQAISVLDDPKATTAEKTEALGAPGMSALLGSLMMKGGAPESPAKAAAKMLGEATPDLPQIEAEAAKGPVRALIQPEERQPQIDRAKELIKESATILPRAALVAKQAIEERTPNAPEERQVAESSVGEHIGTEARGLPPETSGGNRPVTEAQGQASPQEGQAGVLPVEEVVPAIKKEDGTVIQGEKGQSHDDIIEQHNIPATELDRREFVDKQTGQQISREQLATQIPTKREGEAHSTDLKKAQETEQSAPKPSPAELQAQINKQRGIVKRSDSTKKKGKEAKAKLDALEQQLQDLQSTPTTGEPTYWTRESPETDIRNVRPKSGADTGERVRLANGQVWEYKGISGYKIDNQNRVNGWENVTRTPPPEEGAGPGTGVGPGSAHESDVPAAPPQAVAAGARVEQAPTIEMPNGTVTPETPSISLVSSLLTGAKNAYHNLNLALKGVAGKTLPRMTDANRELGEAGARYGSSRIASQPLAQSFAARALEGTDVDPVKFGAALTEDNLRSVRESLRAKATELQGTDPEGSAAATAAADRVATLIGERGGFRTEDEYQDFLADPRTQRAVAQHIQLWQEIIDPQYRAAQSLDPDVELPTRGLQTGARVNMKVLFPEDEAVAPVRGGAGIPSLTATFKRKSPFSIRAKGTGEIYDVDYGSIIGNTFERQLEIANKNAFDKKLVETGNAVIDKPGKVVMIDGKRAVPFPLTRRVIITDSAGEKRSFSQASNIYVKGDLAREYEGVSNVRKNFRVPYLTGFMNLVNKTALAGLTDFTVHTSNLLTALFNRPTSGKIFTDTALSTLGRADIPVTLGKAIAKAYKNNQQQIAELAEIGAGRAKETAPGILGFSGRILKKIDSVTRLVLDDTYKSLVEQGLVEPSETGRREYVNQVGQYNKRLQGPFTAFFRDTGLGPFVTAGKTFNALGVKMATLDPEAAATSKPAAAMLKANVLSKWVGGAVLAGTLNYLFTKDKGGGVMGRPGTPIGRVDFGTNDKEGKPQNFPLFDVMGLGRGLRVTGARGLIQSKYWGLSTPNAIDAAGRDILNSWSSPFAGPPIRSASIMGTGYQPAVNVPRAAPVAAPGKSQFKENVKEAAREVNPAINSYLKYREGAPMSEALSSQLPRFTLSSGRPPEMMARYPKIVSLAQTYAFSEDVVGRARKMSQEQRNRFVTDSIEQLKPELRPIMERILKERKIRWYWAAPKTP